MFVKLCMFPQVYPSNHKILKIIMVVLIRNGGGHCNNDVVSPAMLCVAAFRTPIPTSCKLSLTLEFALIQQISCFLRSSSHPSQVYDPKFASPEAIVIKSDFSHNLDYCKCLVIFNPLKCFIIDPFQCVNCSQINVKKFNPESFNSEIIVKSKLLLH